MSETTVRASPTATTVRETPTTVLLREAPDRYRVRVKQEPVVVRPTVLRVLVQTNPQGPPGSQDSRGEAHGDIAFTYSGELLTRVDWADGFYLTIARDSQSRVEIVTYSNGVIKTLTYDAQGKVTDVTITT